MEDVEPPIALTEQAANHFSLSLSDLVHSAVREADRLCQGGEFDGGRLVLLMEASYALHRAAIALDDFDQANGLTPTLAVPPTAPKNG